MKNYVVFTNHASNVFPETLDISEHRIALIQNKIAFYMLSDKDYPSMSKIIEAVIDGLNPNEVLFAMYLYMKIERTMSFSAALVQDLAKQPPVVLTSMLTMQVSQSAIEQAKDLYNKAKIYANENHLSFTYRL